MEGEELPLKELLGGGKTGSAQGNTVSSSGSTGRWQQGVLAAGNTGSTAGSTGYTESWTDWEERYDGYGRIYYVNRITQVSQWQHPFTSQANEANSHHSLPGGSSWNHPSVMGGADNTASSDDPFPPPEYSLPDGSAWNNPPLNGGKADSGGIQSNPCDNALPGGSSWNSPPPKGTSGETPTDGRAAEDQSSAKRPRLDSFEDKENYPPQVSLTQQTTVETPYRVARLPTSTGVGNAVANYVGLPPQLLHLVANQQEGYPLR